MVALCAIGRSTERSASMQLKECSDLSKRSISAAKSQSVMYDELEVAKSLVQVEDEIEVPISNSARPIGESPNNKL
jgi:hypothetical protein